MKLWILLLLAVAFPALAPAQGDHPRLFRYSESGLEMEYRVPPKIWAQAVRRPVVGAPSTTEQPVDVFKSMWMHQRLLGEEYVGMLVLSSLPIPAGATDANLVETLVGGLQAKTHKRVVGERLDCNGLHWVKITETSPTNARRGRLVAYYGLAGGRLHCLGLGSAADGYWPQKLWTELQSEQWAMLNSIHVRTSASPAAEP